MPAAIERTNRTLSEVVESPNYARLMEHGDARTIGDVLICGSEATMEKRMQGFAEAGVTDLNCRIVPLGEGRDEIKASAERTRRIPGVGRTGAASGQLSARRRIVRFSEGRAQYGGTASGTSRSF